MNFDARDLLEVNHALLSEAALRPTPNPGVLISLATWGRGADPNLLVALQPFRVGLGFNGSIVARVPRDFAREWLPEQVWAQIEASSTDALAVCGSVLKDWHVDFWLKT